MAREPGILVLQVIDRSAGALIDEINGNREGEDCEDKARRVLKRLNQDDNSAPAGLPGRRTRTSRKGIPL
ncbi:hypothetical protein ASL20_24365 [Cupriavidus necator]|nr:hypothetical protein ASL20_24365 [Cupriavidus necator]